MSGVEHLAAAKLHAMTKAPYFLPKTPAPQPVDALPAEPVEWLDTVPAYRDESEVSDA
jgi:hypothetical protein